MLHILALQMTCRKSASKSTPIIPSYIVCDAAWLQTLTLSKSAFWMGLDQGWEVTSCNKVLIQTSALKITERRRMFTIRRSEICFGYGQIQNELYLTGLASGKVLNADFWTHRCDGSQRSLHTIIRASCQVRWSSLPSTEEMLETRMLSRRGVWGYRSN